VVFPGLSKDSKIVWWQFKEENGLNEETLPIVEKETMILQLQPNRRRTDIQSVNLKLEGHFGQLSDLKQNYFSRGRNK